MKKPDYTEWLEEQIEPMLDEWVCDLFAWHDSDYCETHCTSEGVTIKCLRAAFEAEREKCADLSARRGDKGRRQ